MALYVERVQIAAGKVEITQALDRQNPVDTAPRLAGLYA